MPILLRNYEFFIFIVNSRSSKDRYRRRHLVVSCELWSIVVTRFMQVVPASLPDREIGALSTYTYFSMYLYWTKLGYYYTIGYSSSLNCCPCLNHASVSLFIDNRSHWWNVGVHFCFWNVSRFSNSRILSARAFITISSDSLAFSFSTHESKSMEKARHCPIDSVFRVFW